jgi:hypothetical protein
VSYSWAPTTAQVAELVPNRAQDASRLFTTTTFPTAAQVADRIAAICAELAATAGDPDTLAIEATDTVRTAVLTTLKAAATTAATYGTAHSIELSFSSGETRDNQSKAPALWTAYEARKKDLRRAITEFSQGQELGGVNDLLAPAGSFPTKQPAWVPSGYVVDPTTGHLRRDRNWGPW